MADIDLVKIIKDLSSFYGKGVEKLNLSFEKVPVAHMTGKNEVQGLRNLVSQFSNHTDPESDIIQDQWVEYILTHVGIVESNATEVLKELNNHISDKVFFVGNQLGPVDILIYYLMYGTMLNLTFQEKEKYIHFSRWFNNVQQYGETRLGSSKKISPEGPIVIGLLRTGSLCTSNEFMPRLMTLAVTEQCLREPHGKFLLFRGVIRLSHLKSGFDFVVGLDFECPWNKYVDKRSEDFLI